LVSKRLGIHIVLIMACLAIIFVPRLHQKPDPEKAEPATAAASQFLELLDAGDYARSWQVSAALMKEKVTEEEWVDKLTGARSVSGALVERTQKRISYNTAAKDSPDGEYVLLFFDSSFEGQKSAKEQVTVMLEEDDNWRVAGYFIK